MYKIEIPNTVHQLVGMFYRLGMWIDRDTTTFGEFCRKLLYFIYIVSFGLSVALGAITTESKEECVFLTVISVLLVVQFYRMWMILWGKNRLMLLVNLIGSHSTNDRDEFIRIKNKFNRFMIFVRFFMIAYTMATLFSVVVYPITNEKHLIYKIAFPLDYANSKFAFWLADAFLGGGFFCSTISAILNKLVWYLMFSISCEYKILGNQLRHLGTPKRTGSSHLKVSLAVQQEQFSNDLVVAIQTYDKING